jgi:hypothetical protein
VAIVRWLGARQKDEPREAGWTGRLRRVGLALDAYGTPLRDVAIAIDGERAHAMALVWRATRDAAEWAPATAVVSLIDYGERDAGGPWAHRLGALGASLDRRGAELRDPSVIQVEGGFVVSALTPAVTQRGHGWNLVTWEVGAAELEGGR